MYQLYVHIAQLIVLSNNLTQERGKISITKFIKKKYIL
jgi:hypothetical protein